MNLIRESEPFYELTIPITCAEGRATCVFLIKEAS